MSPAIGYGGAVFALTWYIVVFGTWASGASTLSAAFVIAATRIGMTVSGVLLAVLGSLLLFPTHATNTFGSEIAEAILCTTEISVLNMKTILQADHEVDSESLSATLTSGTNSAKTAFDLETCIRLQNQQRLSLLQEAEAEKWLVSRRTPDLAGLQAACEQLLRIAVSTGSIGLTDVVGEDQAARVFLSNATKHGLNLKDSIVKLQEALRAEALSLVVFLHGIRAPMAMIGSENLRVAHQTLQQNLGRVRHELRESNRLVSLVPLGLDCFYAQVHGLSSFAERWLELADSICAEASQGKQKMSTMDDDWCPSTSASQGDGGAMASPLGSPCSSKPVGPVISI
jgi:hypothetical protein